MKILHALFYTHFIVFVSLKYLVSIFSIDYFFLFLVSCNKIRKAVYGTKRKRSSPSNY